MRILPVNNTIMNSVTYVLYSEDVDYCILIDCGEWDTLKPYLEKIEKKVKSVLLTHGHSDHIYGLIGLLNDYPLVEIYSIDSGHDQIRDSRKNMSFYHGNPFTIENYNEKLISDGNIIHFDGLEDVEVIATPGHDSSCLTYKVGKDIFTGDAYIPGINVFAKFPRSNKKQAIISIEKLKQMENEGCIVHCGHHSYSFSTI